MATKIFVIISSLLAARNHASRDDLSTFTVTQQGLALVQTRATKTAGVAIPIVEPTARDALAAYSDRQIAHLNADISERMQATEVEDRPYSSWLSKAAVTKIKGMTGTVWIWGAYHKTGCEFLVSMLSSMKHTDVTEKPGGEPEHDVEQDLNQVLTNILAGKKKVFTAGYWDNFFYEPDYGVINMIPDYRFVHMIRDPVDLVVSAYRYHASCPSGEPWAMEPMNKMSRIDKITDLVKLHLPPIYKKFALALNQGRSLCEFYQQDDIAEWEGVKFEAFRSHHEIIQMNRTYALTMYDPNVLQVTTKGVIEDFNKTMHCVFKYMGKSRPINQQHIEEIIAPLDVQYKPKGDEHVTTGKYDNDNIITVVEMIPHVQDARRHMQRNEKNLESPSCGSL